MNNQEKYKTDIEQIKECLSALKSSISLHKADGHLSHYGEDVEHFFSKFKKLLKNHRGINKTPFNLLGNKLKSLSYSREMNDEAEIVFDFKNLYEIEESFLKILENES
ncbi:MAG: hypothetical protein LR005_02065 [Candidatus Pacebacteria bacterium]|nr:hypothetical protein [Candidatus Paceibacterota bacterium]